MSNFKFFKDEEIVGLQTPLPAMLDMAHGISNQAMAEATKGKVTYVIYRLTFTTGGVHVSNSEHYKGLSVDIGLGHLAEGFERNTVRWAIMKGLFGAGFKRIEDCERHIHVGIGESPDYQSPTMWIGKDE